MRGIDELDHYELLEIKRTASPAEIDRAYRMAQQTYREGSLALYSVFERTDAAAITMTRYSPNQAPDDRPQTCWPPLMCTSAPFT